MPSEAELIPAHNAGSRPHVPAHLHDSTAPFYCNLFLSPIYFFYAIIKLSFLSLGCHKFTSMTHRINVSCGALSKGDWHPQLLGSELIGRDFMVHFTELMG